MVIINPHVQHTEKSGSESPLEYIVLGINGLSFSFENVTSAQDGISMQTSFGTVYKYNMQGCHVCACLNMMLEEITHKNENYETACQNLLEVLLIYILRNDDLSIVKSGDTILNRECAQIKNYLDSNYSENITLDTLAAITHMNKYYMAHAFTLHYGCSPIRYLCQTRIEASKELLANTDYSITEVAQYAGFSSQSYFAQCFSKSCGVTASAYRKSCKETLTDFSKQKPPDSCQKSTDTL